MRSFILRADPATCRDCGIALAGLGVRPVRGWCRACYLWHWRHGWGQERPAPATHCASCGVAFLTSPHAARGRCHACWVWHQRHGWDRQRPALQVACADCGRPWSAAPHAGHGFCSACYSRRRRRAQGWSARAEHS